LLEIFINPIISVTFEIFKPMILGRKKFLRNGHFSPIVGKAIMIENAVQRHYPFKELDFRDFWDICGHFQRMHPKRDAVLYSIFDKKGLRIKEETEIPLILESLNKDDAPLTRFEARLISCDDFDERDEDCPLITFTHKEGTGKTGLHFQSAELEKLSLFQFEAMLYEQYNLQKPQASEMEIVFGRPCEVLATVVDMRGFSLFCEKPNIESPYTSGLMSSFYQLVKNSFLTYPPELMKYLGDGVLSVWETSYKDRELAISTCLHGLSDLNARWQILRQSPQFSHGTPKDIGIGISFGLASMLTVDQDYIGRPINIASRLCSVCNGKEILIDKSLPKLPEDLSYDDYQVSMKSFGRADIWRMQTA